MKLLATILLLGTVAATPPAKTVPIPDRVAKLEAEVADLKARLDVLESGRVTFGGQGAAKGVDPAEIAKAMKEGRVCLGMTKDQAASIAGKKTVRYHDELRNGRAFHMEAWELSEGTQLYFDESGIVTRIGN